MFRIPCLAISAALSVAAFADAGVFITSEGVPTIDLPGFTTWTLTAHSDDGRPIQGFDFARLPEFGFFGPTNQVNPATVPTIFMDNNPFFPFVGANASQDSQFKFFSNTVTVPGGFSSEGPDRLRSIFASPTPLGTSVPFVQIAIPNSAGRGAVVYRGQIQTVGGPNVVTDNNVLGGIPAIPEPATITLLALLAGFAGRRRFRRAN
jgi:hypothetical protein